jgi:antitoxin CptB
MTGDLDSRRRRAGYRANYRGTKEMDWLLGRYAQARLPDMAAADLALFERLLALPDPDLQTWILDPSTLGDSAFSDLIQHVRQFHKLDRTPG